MNMTQSQFRAIEAALRLLPQGDAFKELSADNQAVIVEAEAAMMALYKKRIRNNKRTAQYIAEKRKDNKDYARGGKKHV